MERSLVPTFESKALAKVRKHIVDFLPVAAQAPPGVQLALAYVTLAYGLDPFMGDVWPIPRKDKKTGKVAGWSLMFGITARLKIAHRSGQLDYIKFRWCTEDEAELLGAKGKGGVKMVACEVKRKDCAQPFVGLGVVFPNDPSRMNHGQLAKLRAQRGALKLAFPVELPSVAEALGEVTIEDLEEEVIEGEAEVVEEADAGRESDEKPRSVKQNMLDLGFFEEVE